MFKNIPTLNNPERFAKAPELSKNKLNDAAEKAIKKLETFIPRFYDKFPNTCTENFKHTPGDTFNWESGMLTGAFWLAYELTGDKKFRDVAERHIDIYAEGFNNPIYYNDHDTGFIIIPSCIAGYKLTGSEKARETALKAAEVLNDHYSWINHFVIRSGKGETDPKRYYCYRTMVDSMMNIPLFYWAYEQTDDEKFLIAANEHYRTTMKYLIREDGSSFHHYQFDPKTHRAVGGVTLQGNSDNSCWGRGHSWLLYGFPIAYSYTGNAEIPDVHKAVSYFMLNKLPSDYIPYWDFDFTEGSPESRDTSVAAITACGFNEMCRHLPDDSEQKKIFANASALMLNALIDNCQAKDDEDGLINKVTHAKPQGQGIEECAVYGDYFYLEAIMRYLRPDWKMYW